MSKGIKNQQQILEKLKIAQLNPMQEEAQLAIESSKEVILLSPTGTGKTLAFLLPIIKNLDPEIEQPQVLILTPSRELALQIEQVVREMGTGYKVNAIYGGRPMSKDKEDLQHPPTILVGTPGRIADHLRRKSFTVKFLTNLVLDEFDKSLEIGFEPQMMEILDALTLKKKILTSATKESDVPAFVGLKAPLYVDYLGEKLARLTLKSIVSPTKDKLQTLLDALCHLGDQPGIVFLNYKDSIQRVSEFLEHNNISHGCFYGGMEQQDRERALIKFRNGTHRLLLATDLAARGIDVVEIKFIIHYHLPLKSEEFTHRNGRTARMHGDGTAYILKYVDEYLPEFIPPLPIVKLDSDQFPEPTGWTTIFVSGGRRDKISKGDIAGIFFKQAGLSKDELGVIELKQECAFVAVSTDKVAHVVKTLNDTKLKKRKLRIHAI